MIRDQNTSTSYGSSTQATTWYAHFKSANELADWFEEKRKLNGPLNGYHPHRSDAHATAIEGLNDLRKGTLDNLDKAQEIVDKLALTIDLSSPMPRLYWQCRISGK
jgi:hypothetical protein